MDAEEFQKAIKNPSLRRFAKAYMPDFYEENVKYYRTKDKAEDSLSYYYGEEEEHHRLPVIVDLDYNKGLSFTPNESDSNHLIALNEENAKLYMAGISFSQAVLEELGTNKEVGHIDLTPLRIFYGCILDDFKEKVEAGEIDKWLQNPSVEMYVPTINRLLGKDSRMNEKSVRALVNTVGSYQNIIGVMEDKSIYAVLLFEAYDKKRNIIRFSSPYMRKLIGVICGADGDKREGIVIEPNTTIKRLEEAHSRLIHTSISKERNRAAVEIVYQVVQVIEMDSTNNPTVSAEQLVRSNAYLVQRLNDAADKPYANQRQNEILKRAFTKAWELLYEKTDLKKVYVELEFPTPNEPKNIPRVKDLKKKSFVFSHKGKIIH